MTATARALDFNQPDSAKRVGTELAATSVSLVATLKLTTAIDSTAALEQFVIDRQQLGDAIKRVLAFFGPLKGMAHELHSALCSREREILAPLQQLDDLKRRAIAEYKAQCDRERQQREREEAELRRREEQDRAAAEAAQLEAAGEVEMAAAVIAEAIAAPPPVVALPDETKSVDGLKFRRRWLWRYAGGPKEIADTPPLVFARALAQLPIAYHCVDEKKIGAVVRSSKGTIEIPGIEVYYVDEPVR